MRQNNSNGIKITEIVLCRVGSGPYGYVRGTIQHVEARLHQYRFHDPNEIHFFKQITLFPIHLGQAQEAQSASSAIYPDKYPNFRYLHRQLQERFAPSMFINMSLNILDYLAARELGFPGGLALGNLALSLLDVALHLPLLHDAILDVSIKCLLELLNELVDNGLYTQRHLPEIEQAEQRVP